MTPLEDKLRAAIRAKADQVPPAAVPPLRLTSGGRRSCPLARGGGGRAGAPRRRGWLVPAAAGLMVAAVVGGSVIVARVADVGRAPGRHSSGPATLVEDGAARDKAAAWITAQVSRQAIVSCDPQMCQALQAHGVPARGLLKLRAGTADPLSSAVIVATAAVRRQFGNRLASVYAPAVLASFGSGSARVDVRVTAPNGAAAYRLVLSRDLTGRKTAGSQLLHNQRIAVSAMARRPLLAGRADSRLLVTVAALAALRPVSVVAFSDAGPGASAGVPLRSITLAAPGQASRRDRSAYLRHLIKFLNRQRAPYGPARTEIVRRPGDRSEVRVEFAAPSPLGLLGG